MTFCDACETCGHCSRHGCIPITTEEPPPAARAALSQPAFDAEQSKMDRLLGIVRIWIERDGGDGTRLISWMYSQPASLYGREQKPYAMTTEERVAWVKGHSAGWDAAKAQDASPAPEAHPPWCSGGCCNAPEALIEMAEKFASDLDEQGRASGAVVRILAGQMRAAALAAPEAPTVEDMCARIKAADDAAADGDYMMDSKDCISVLRGTWKGPLAMDMPAKPPSVEQAITALVTALAESKGWMRDYADSVVRDAIERRVPDAMTVDCPHCSAKTGESCLWPETRETNRDHPHKARAALMNLNRDAGAAPNEGLSQPKAAPLPEHLYSRQYEGMDGLSYYIPTEPPAAKGETK